MKNKMKPYTHVVVLDFEATCDDVNRPRPQEIIEFPSVLVSTATGKAVDTFEAFVRPFHHPRLTPFCTDFTSIQQADVDAAEPFASVFRAHQTWLAGHGLDETNALIATCGDWDLKTMLPGQCAVAKPPVEEIPPIYSRWLNLKRPFCSVTGRRRAPGMKGMLGAFDLRPEGHHHRGIDDCHNLARLLVALIERGASLAPTSSS